MDRLCHCNNADAFATQFSRLYGDAALWETLRAEALQCVVDKFSPDVFENSVPLLLVEWLPIVTLKIDPNRSDWPGRVSFSPLVRFQWDRMEALGRVELPTNGLGNRCSIHLSYRATLRNRLLLV